MTRIKVLFFKIPIKNYNFRIYTAEIKLVAFQVYDYVRDKTGIDEDYWIIEQPFNYLGFNIFIHYSWLCLQ